MTITLDFLFKSSSLVWLGFHIYDAFQLLVATKSSDLSKQAEYLLLQIYFMYSLIFEIWFIRKSWQIYSSPERINLA